MTTYSVDIPSQIFKNSLVILELLAVVTFLNDQMSQKIVVVFVGFWVF